MRGVPVCAGTCSQPWSLPGVTLSLYLQGTETDFTPSKEGGQCGQSRALGW